MQDAEELGEMLSKPEFFPFHSQGSGEGVLEILAAGLVWYLGLAL